MTSNLGILSILFVLSSSCDAQLTSTKEVKGFTWTEGEQPKSEYQFNIALSTTDEIYTIGGKNEGAFEVFDTKTWTTLDPLPSPRVFTSGVILGNALYVIGGINNAGMYSTKVEKYDLLKKKWTASRNLLTPRSRLASVVYNEKIYAIGGLEGTDDKNYHNSAAVEQYNPNTNSWTRITEMPTPRHGHSAVVVDHKILIVGGYTDTGPTNIVEEYDPENNIWTTKSEMHTPRGFFGLVTIGNFVYAIAGRVKEDKGPIEQYDVENNVWKQLEPLADRRNRFGIATLDNIIYIIGGEDNPKSVLVGEIKNK